MKMADREGLLFVHSTNEPLLYPGWYDAPGGY